MKSTCGGAPQALTFLEELVVKNPNIKFSEWFAWDERNCIPNCNKPGVYLLAHFTDPPQGATDPLDAHVRYIGQTCGHKGVRERLRRFNNSSRTGKKGHKGGETYYSKYNAIHENLYVSAFTVSDLTRSEVRNAFILFVERELIWKFSVAHGKLPKCNKR